MTRGRQIKPLDHDACWEIIPWFVNGSLNADEREAAEAHVESCDECRREIAAQADMQRELAALEASSREADRGWQRLLAELDELPNQPSRRRLSTRRMLLAAAVLQIALFGALAGLIGWLHGEPAEHSFRTLSTPQAVLNAPGAHFRLVTAPQTEISQLQAVLLPLQGRIIDGPTAGGVITVSVPASRRNEALRSLREQSFILLAEPLPAPGP